MKKQDHVHSFATTVVPPTCQRQGYTLHRCSCGYEYKDRYVPAQSHAFEVIETSTSVCAEARQQILRCKHCGTTETRTLPAAGHKWSAWNVHFVPSCTEEGIQSRRCIHCGTVEKRTIKATGHKLVSRRKSLSQKGMVECFCENCGATILKPSFSKKSRKWLLGGIFLIILVAAIALAFAASLFFSLPAPKIASKLCENGSILMGKGRYDEAYQHIKACQICYNEDLLQDFYFYCGTETCYDSSGALVYTKESKCDAASRRIISHNEEKVYDENALLTKKILYQDNGAVYETTEYIYDTIENLISAITYSADGIITSKCEYTYDEKNLLQQVTHFSESGTVLSSEEYTYDEDGTRKSMITRKDTGKMTTLTRYVYDQNGNLKKMFEHHANGKIVSQYAYTYDKQGNMTGQTQYDSKNQVVYTYKYEKYSVVYLGPSTSLLSFLIHAIF